MAAATRAHGILSRVIESAAKVGNAKAAIPPTKTMERAAEKVAKDYGGDWTRITDIARGSVVATSVPDLTTAYDTFQSQVDIKKIKNRFKDTKEDGYRDLSVVVQVPGTEILGEVQFHVEQIQNVKMGEGHDIYEQIQAIERKTGRTSDDEERLKELKAKSRSLYDEAYASALSGSKSTASKTATKGHGAPASSPASEAPSSPPDEQVAA